MPTRLIGTILSRSRVGREFLTFAAAAGRAPGDARLVCATQRVLPLLRAFLITRDGRVGPDNPEVFHSRLYYLSGWDVASVPNIPPLLICYLHSCHYVHYPHRPHDRHEQAWNRRLHFCLDVHEVCVNRLISRLPGSRAVQVSVWCAASHVFSFCLA